MKLESDKSILEARGARPLNKIQLKQITRLWDPQPERKLWCCSFQSCVRMKQWRTTFPLHDFFCSCSQLVGQSYMVLSVAKISGCFETSSLKNNWPQAAGLNNTSDTLHHENFTVQLDTAVFRNHKERRLFPKRSNFPRTSQLVPILFREWPTAWCIWRTIVADSCLQENNRIFLLANRCACRKTVTMLSVTESLWIWKIWGQWSVADVVFRLHGVVQNEIQACGTQVFLTQIFLQIRKVEPLQEPGTFLQLQCADAFGHRKKWNWTPPPEFTPWTSAPQFVGMGARFVLRGSHFISPKTDWSFLQCNKRQSTYSFQTCQGALRFLCCFHQCVSQLNNHPQLIIKHLLVSFLFKQHCPFPVINVPRINYISHHVRLDPFGSELLLAASASRWIIAVPTQRQ